MGTRATRLAAILAPALVAVGVALVGRPAWCQEEETAQGSEPAGEGRGEQRVKVALFILPDDELDQPVATEIEAAMRRGLRAQSSLQLVDPSTALEQAEDVDRSAADRAGQLLGEAFEMARRDQWEQVVSTLDVAVELFESNLTLISRIDIEDSYMLWGAAQCMLRRRRACESAFRRVLTFREGLVYDTERLPESVAPIFDRVREETLGGPRGSIMIESFPPGAEVYADGRFIGAAPTRIEGLLAGDHYVTLKMLGYHRLVSRVTVRPDFEDTMSFELMQLDRARLLTDALRDVREQMGGPRAGPALRDLWALLFVNQVVLGRLARVGEGDEFDLSLYLYDLRTQHGLRRLNERVNWSDRDFDAAEQLAINLYAGVDLAGHIRPREEEIPLPPAPRPPFYRTWWFWSIAGLIVVGTTVGVASALVRPGLPQGTSELVIEGL